MHIDSPLPQLGNAVLFDAACTLQSDVPPEDALHLEYLRDWIFTHTGLYFSSYKRLQLYRRLMALCWRLGIPNLGGLARRLREQPSPKLVMEVACAVSTSHTFFFREPEVLQYIPRRIVLQLPDGKNWRIWSAATASGDEAYSIAILLAEQFGLEQVRQRVAILGTDISQPMIEKAESGVYVEQRLELVPLSLRQRYFQSVGLDQWRVIPELREMCTFRRMNLQSMPYPFQNSFHIILCRNVLYYFDTTHQERLVEQMYEVTEPGGWLITSVTETLHNIPTHWRKVAAGVFRKV